MTWLIREACSFVAVAVLMGSLVVWAGLLGGIA
ncbi:hypothetical protein SAMN05216548_10831 [Faunimonas pinastri]|uniref:Uncharacterized protein n=1 Tax=Faunimonas pinastri TaxID=1855383 RepID=A0A1H9J754_9HYPH|nr:hypothetical protein SAMN05216548_10831 [Faunimonas pinastri]